MVFEDRPLAAARVVLGKPRDLLEELGAALVVEVARRELLEGLGQARAHVRRHSGQGAARWQMDIDGDVGGGFH